MDKIRFGIVGAAGRGNSFVRTLQAHAATEIAALCDIRADEVEANAADLGVEHAFTDAADTRNSVANTKKFTAARRTR